MIVAGSSKIISGREGGVLAAGETETGLQININGLSDTIYTARVSQTEFVLPFFAAQDV